MDKQTDLIPSSPNSHPWVKTQATKQKSCLICFISFICEKKYKVRFKIFLIDFAKSSSYTEFVWISSNGLEGDSVNDRRTE